MNFKVYQIAWGPARKTEQLIKHTERLVKRLRNKSQYRGLNMRGFILMATHEEWGYVSIHFWSHKLVWEARHYCISWLVNDSTEMSSTAELPADFIAVIDHEYQILKSPGYFTHIYKQNT